MTIPSAETARNWSGLTAVDSDEQPLGRIADIYLDHDTGQPEWALVATPQRGRRTFVPLAGAARTGDRVTVAVPKAAVGDAPAVRPGRELSDNDAARLYGHYVGTSGDRHRGARRARGRGPVARRRAATAPPTRSASARLREARGRVPQAGGSGRLRWLPLAGLGSALLVVVGILAGRRRRRRAPTLGEALRRALGELLAAFQAALPRGRGRRWFGSLGGPRRGGDRWRGAGWGQAASRRS
jgi:hypothetical protein